MTYTPTPCGRAFSIKGRFPHGPRIRALALCLSAALATPFAVPYAATSHHKVKSMPSLVATPNILAPALAQTWTVKNCNDSGADSLRDIIENPVNAKSGDTVDLSQLPTLCGMGHSTITLSSGEIAINQDDLTLQGPMKGTVTISAAGLSRVLNHTGVGTLVANNLTVSDGYVHAPSWNAYGGCIVSAGSVDASKTTIMNCRAVSDYAYASGGGIFAANELTLTLCTLSDNEANAPVEGSYGGGAYAKHLSAKYSTLSDNAAEGGVFGGKGGGAFAFGGMVILASTIDHNAATIGSGLWFHDSTSIVSSTISGNTAHKFGAAYAGYSADLTIVNSTIALNHAETEATYGAVTFEGGTATASLTLQSSVIALNTVGIDSTPSDIWVNQGQLVGSDNLVMASSDSPPGVITVTADPMLGPLRSNGGPTRTHRLLPGSPALGKGNVNGLAPPWNTTDQRGVGYPRTTGGNASVDLGAVQFDSIFADDFDVFY